MSIIERVKNCEGCRKRRKFLKEAFSGIFGAIGLSLLLPSKSKAQLNCECQHCTNGDICLCCDPSCDHCSITSRERCCVQVLEFCDGEPHYTGICCTNGTCPGVSQTEEKHGMTHQWKVALDGPQTVYVRSSNGNLDVLDWLSRHNFCFETRSGKSLKAVTANKVVD